MTREALLLSLAAHVAAGRLTRDEARALVSAYDSGADTLTLDAPLSRAALAALVAASVTQGRRRLATVLARLLNVPAGVAAAARAGDARAVSAVLSYADRLPLPRRVGMVDALRADDLRGALARETDRAVSVLLSTAEDATFGPGVAGSARRSAGDVARFQRRITAAYAEDAAVLARLGAGGELTSAQTARLARVVADKAAYVDGLAVRLAQDAAGLTPKALSERQIRAAVVRNSGDARGLFFDNAVEQAAEGLAFPVERYVPRDLPSTCDPCSDAAGFYRIGEGPRPGVLCRGGGYCRCEVVVEDNATEYARLTA